MPDNALSRRLREIQEAEAVASLEPEPELTVEEDASSPSASPPGRRPLGQLLISKGLISEETLEAALEQQRRDGRPLGQILLATGALTPQNLARTLTEQHGFDFSGSLRERLANGDLEQPEVEVEHSTVETYVLCKPGEPEPLHVATAFLDAADVAFELIEDEQPEELEIVRVKDGERETLWAYNRDDAASAPAPEL